MCKINPIINGEHNLCRVSKFLNRTKNKKCKQSVTVLAYMEKMKEKSILNNVLMDIVKALPESQESKDFVSNLRLLLKAAYGLEISDC